MKAKLMKALLISSMMAVLCGTAVFAEDGEPAWAQDDQQQTQQQGDNDNQQKQKKHKKGDQKANKDNNNDAQNDADNDGDNGFAPTHEIED
jgi:hypothetical protein